MNKKGQGLSDGKNVKIWTNSEYAFNVFGEVIWKERGLATVQGLELNTLNRPIHCYRVLRSLEKQPLYIARFIKIGKQLLS